MFPCTAVGICWGFSWVWVDLLALLLPAFPQIQTTWALTWGWGGAGFTPILVSQQFHTSTRVGFTHLPGVWGVRGTTTRVAPLLCNEGSRLTFVSLILLPLLTRGNPYSHQTSHLQSHCHWAWESCKAFCTNYVETLPPVASRTRKTRRIWTSARLQLWQVETWQGCYHKAQQWLYTQLHLWFLWFI